MYFLLLEFRVQEIYMIIIMYFKKQKGQQMSLDIEEMGNLKEI
jgi:hypothetical protein